MVDLVYSSHLESAVPPNIRENPNPAADPGNIKFLHQLEKYPQDIDSVTTQAQSLVVRVPRASRINRSARKKEKLCQHLHK